MAEVAVHLTLATLPDYYLVLPINIPDNVEIIEITESDLPEDWKEFPNPKSAQKFGNDFVSEKQFCVLKIHSVVIQGDFNFLIDPNHKDFNKIIVTKMDKFTFDNWIFK